MEVDMSGKKISSGAIRNAERGFTLIGAVLLVALFTISLSVAVPQVIQEIRRDKELEAIHRGQQYARAIRLFYRRTGSFPTDISQLENTNNIRYLRKQYLDPITNHPWKLVYQGEVKPEILQTGFFGSSSRVQVASSIPAGVIPGLASGVPGSGYGGNGGITHFLNPRNGQPDNQLNSSGVQSSADSAGNGTGATAGAEGSTVRRGRIVGVSSISTEASIRIYKKQTHYNDWQFIYDPIFDGIVGGGQPAPTPSNLSPTSGTLPQPLPAQKQ
jgi:type II secretory pathway pseudopilin PulG